MYMFLNDRYEESKNDEIPDCRLLSVEHTYQRWFRSFDKKTFTQLQSQQTALLSPPQICKNVLT